MIEKLESLPLSLTKFVTPRELFKLVPNGNSIDIYMPTLHTGNITHIPSGSV